MLICISFFFCSQFCGMMESLSDFSVKEERDYVQMLRRCCLQVRERYG